MSKKNSESHLPLDAFDEISKVIPTSEISSTLEYVMPYSDICNLVDNENKDLNTVSLEEDMLVYAGAGFENASSECYSVPVIKILEPLSELEDCTGMRAGTIFNPVTGESSESLIVAPVFFKRSFLEWTPRGQGGGSLVAIHDSVPASAKQDGFKITSEKGHDIVDTRMHYVVIIDNDLLTPAIIPFAKTRIKKSALWMTLLRNQRIIIHKNGRDCIEVKPHFATTFKLTVKKESNAVGKWHTWNIEKIGSTPKNAYEFAKAFYKDLISSKISDQESFSETSL